MDARRRRFVAYVGLLVLAAAFLAIRGQFADRIEPADAVFLVKPYVQWGDAPRTNGELAVLWQADDRDAAWSVEAKGAETEAWSAFKAPTPRWYEAGRVGPRRLWRATITGRAPGEEFAYRVRRDGRTVFEAKARAPKAAGQPHRFVAFGDGGADTSAQRAIAYQTFRARPDFVVVTGDLVYYKGLMSEYLTKFFPIYNRDDASPATGAPLLRSIPFLVSPGNHDLIERNLDRCPDALAYFLVWALPQNGPMTAPGAANTPTLLGTESRRRAFLESAGPAYPRTANYAFDYGDAHWTVLDTNLHVDWTDPTLRDWLERDLASAQGAPWRFVAFHQPPFHSTQAHSDEQWTRLLVNLFEKYRVDLVFNGHIHNYQRSYPLHFIAETAKEGRAVDPSGRVAGRWTLDRAFDGWTRTRPDGIIYLVTGAGGARLYDSWSREGSSRQEFTAKFAANTHSLTVVDVEAARLVVRQISSGGEEIDRFVVTRRGEEDEPPRRQGRQGRQERRTGVCPQMTRMTADRRE
jgi:hypothetical protein